MDNKLNNMLQEFFENNTVENIDDANEKLQEFMKMYNSGAIEYENTPLDDAYEILEKAKNTASKKQALKYAKEAYDMCPECFDALLFQCELEKSTLKRDKLLDEGLEKEKERLKKDKYFNKESIGHFYGIFETRPYIRGLYDKALYLIEDGKIKQARDICKEILRLNNNDNLGARYMLMAIYAYLEEEHSMQYLYKKYPEDDLEMLFPFFALYYKEGNDEQAIKYLNKINKENPHFIKYFKGTINEDENAMAGYYSIGQPSEVIMYFNGYSFLTDSIPNIKEYILENIK